MVVWRSFGQFESKIGGSGKSLVCMYKRIDLELDLFSLPSLLYNNIDNKIMVLSGQLLTWIHETEIWELFRPYQILWRHIKDKWRKMIQTYLNPTASVVITYRIACLPEETWEREREVCVLSILNDLSSLQWRPKGEAKSRLLLLCILDVIFSQILNFRRDSGRLILLG